MNFRQSSMEGNSLPSLAGRAYSAPVAGGYVSHEPQVVPAEVFPPHNQII